MNTHIAEESYRQLKELALPRYENLPSFGIYVDQLTSFVNDTVDFSYTPGEKPLTASMVNNYVKQGVVPKPEKKKYSRDHVAYLIVVCILKKVFSIHEITGLIQIQTKAYQTKLAYNSFIGSLEHIIAQVFFDEIPEGTRRSDLTEDVLFVEKVALTFANKLYTQIQIACRAEGYSTAEDTEKADKKAKKDSKRN